jgi:ribonuclease J
MASHTKTLRILPLGGVGGIGKNMTVIEYGNNMLIVDVGVMFPPTDMQGVDFILPNYEYVLERKDNLRGVIITHGHLDHIGGLQFLLQQVQTPVYAMPFPLGMIGTKLTEMGIKGDLRTMNDRDPVLIGPFRVNAFRVTHSIPDAVGYVIHTPVGNIVHTGDYKLDETPYDGHKTDLLRLKKLLNESGGALVLLADSTNADRPGHTPSDSIVAPTLAPIFAAAPGRVIVSTFASQVQRVQQIHDAATRVGRQVAIAGRGLLENITLARNLGYVKAPGLLPMDLALNLPPAKLVIVATGTQGEPNSALTRMSRGDHPHVRIQESDTIVVSGRPIPGKEVIVSRVINHLFNLGAFVIYGNMASIHTSGHGSQGDMRIMLETVKPKYFLPVHGELRHQILHTRIGLETGIPEHQMFVLRSYQPWEYDGKTSRVLGALPYQDVRIAGQLMADTNETVLRDRERLATDGFVVVVVPVDGYGQLAGRLQILSRGFVHLRDAAGLLEATNREIKRLMREKQGPAHEFIRDGLGDFFYKNTNRRPVILPSIIRVDARNH